ncbi:TetR/AcrR family transcriptional regulator [Iamia sp. SCSIO 61187]|uniref:TetR/AcrR family transcriptional regulator n=1 Tax=Iamia sp. SCSIO 61187 TaxID=2722752 RepID=UPI001C629DF2|nr:TetR/AcrR family transcriptional regulator [Iamia sp. SCSIO 61187]QYG94487.1 TetR/AcrR family transcriptional regulator [Iamia sp. SCSIO 61187]
MARSAITSWRSDAPASIDEARNRLIDAAEACFSRFGVNKTTLDDIANTAGVSRATVYRYFDGGRDEIILAVVLREARAFLDSLRRRVQREPDLTDAIVEGVLYTVASVRKNDNLALLFAPEVAGQTTAIAGASTALFELATDFLRPIFTAAGVDDRLRPGVEAEDAAEYVLRIILSMLSVSGPKARSQAKERAFVRTYCAGAILAD